MASPELARILRILGRHKRALDLDRGLGAELCNLASAVSENNFDSARKPDGTPWEPLDPRYERWKETHAITTTMGYLHGVLGTTDNFEGERTITATTAEWTFGKGQAAKDECDWFSRGDPARNRPGRPFVGISHYLDAAAGAVVTRRLRRSL